MIDIGSVLADRYELRARLGAGGMGEVYRAFDRELEREVAIKTLLPHLARDEQLLQRFRREARTLARVRHPAIIALFDILRLNDGAFFLVLELVPGHPLETELQGGALPWERCVDIGSQVCGALAAAHARDVVHRDIKPSNILLEPEGVVRVADFGIARLAGASQVTRQGVSMGTPGFWAPEQALGKPSSPQTDIYSVGAVLFQASTGRMPFVAEEDGPAAALMNVTRPVPDPREANPDLPDVAAQIIMRAMAKEPDDRFASAIEMAGALRMSIGGPAVTPVDRLVTTPPDGVGRPEIPPPLTPPGAPETRISTPAPVSAAGARASDPGAPMSDPGGRVSAAGTPVSDPERPVTDIEAEAAGRTVPGRGAPLTGEPAMEPAEGGRGRIVAAITGVAVVAAIAGIALGGGFGGDDTSNAAPDPVRVRAGAGSLALPGDWSSSAGGGLPGLGLRNAVTAAPDGAVGPARLVAGVSGAVGPSLLPPAFVERLAGPPARDDRVLLGETEAYRYRDLTVEGVESPVTVFVVPTTAGVQTIGCVTPPESADFATSCEAVAASLRLSGARSFVLGPDAGYAESLGAALTRLSEARTPLRRELARAATPAAQARLAERLVAPHRRAASDAAAGRLGPEGAGLAEGVAEALRAQAEGYAAMAAGARDDDPRAFASGADGVRAGEARLRAALEAMSARGYTIGGG